MTELVMLLGQSKSEIVNALRIKTLLWDKGIEVAGLVVRNGNSGHIPPEFIEDMMRLKVVGFLT